jgi:hypothetical protein
MASVNVKLVGLVETVVFLLALPDVLNTEHALFLVFVFVTIHSTVLRANCSSAPKIVLNMESATTS